MDSMDTQATLTGRIMNKLDLQKEISLLEAQLRQLEVPNPDNGTSPWILDLATTEPDRPEVFLRARYLGNKIGDNMAKKWGRKAPKTDSRNESASNSFIEKAKVSERSNIIVFGEAGSGKSSLVNMIAGQSCAKVANSATGVTFTSDPYEVDLPDGQLIRIWDTAGLNEALKGKINAQTAIGNLYKLTRKLDSVHLLVYCVRQRITESTVKNYKMFNAFCDGKVPIAIVVTGLELDPKIREWWPSNREAFEREGIKVVAHACVATVEIRGREAEYEEWTKTVRKVIVDNQLPLDAPWTMEQDGWFSSTVAKFFEILFDGQSRKLRQELMKVGFSPKEADEAAKKCIR